MSDEDLDGRMSVAVRAATLDALDEALVALPPLQRAYDGEHHEMDGQVVASSDVPPRGVVAAIVGGAERKGRWLLPRHLKVWAVLGGVEIDLRQARMSAGVTEIEVTAIMGSVEIYLPPNVTVESTGMAFAGGFGATTGDAEELDPGRPVIRLTGMAAFGGVEARVKHVDPRKLAKFQKKLAKKRRD